MSETMFLLEWVFKDLCLFIDIFLIRGVRYIAKTDIEQYRVLTVTSAADFELELRSKLSSMVTDSIFWASAGLFFTHSSYVFLLSSDASVIEVIFLQSSWLFANVW